MIPPTVGLSVHTGWMIAVVAGGSLESPELLHRERLMLCRDDLPRMVYHACEDLSLSEAAEVVARVVASANELARSAIRQLVAAVPGLELAGVLGAAPGTEEVDLAGILSSHARIHTGEGELYRRVVADACAASGIATSFVAPRSLAAEADAVLAEVAVDPTELVSRTGRSAGPPWRVDHKQAFLAALVVAARSSAPT